METEARCLIYDIIVIGAGPAGCAAALTAARAGAKTLLLERGRFPRHKVCGEFVSAESLGIIEDLLGPEHDSLVREAPRIRYSRIFADRTELRAEISPAAASITRFELDRALWNSCLRREVEAREDCEVRSIRDFQRNADRKPQFEVITANTSFTGRAVINTSGRWSALTSSERRASAGESRWIGLKCHFREEAPSDSVDLYFFEGGYCGVQPVSNAGQGPIVNACAMVRPEVAKTLPEVLRSHSALEERSRAWIPMMDMVSTSPLIFHEPEPIREHMLQAGDAAMFVDPFVGDGISLALRSGVMAAESLNSYVRGECSHKAATDEYSRLYHKRLSKVFRSSAHIRRVLSWPCFFRTPLLSLLQNSPLLARQLVRMTR